MRVAAWCAIRGVSNLPTVTRIVSRGRVLVIVVVCESYIFFAGSGPSCWWLLSTLTLVTRACQEQQESCGFFLGRGCHACDRGRFGPLASSTPVQRVRPQKKVEPSLSLSWTTMLLPFRFFGVFPSTKHKTPDPHDNEYCNVVK